MDKYRIPNINLPGTLYRVDFPGSRTKYNQTGCLLAAEKTKLYDDVSELKTDVLDQYFWRSGNPSPFIALFSTREAAESWASEEPWRDGHGDEPLTPPHMDWTISVIDVSKLQKSLFFRLKDLVDELALWEEIPEGDWYYAENTYLVLHRVAAAAVIERFNAAQVGQQRIERAMAELEPEDE
ncbi:hypothetical protein BDV18DRAFT_159899 [Aspergillus unguis]